MSGPKGYQYQVAAAAEARRRAAEEMRSQCRALVGELRERREELAIQLASSAVATPEEDLSGEVEQLTAIRNRLQGQLEEVRAQREQLRQQRLSERFAGEFGDLHRFAVDAEQRARPLAASGQDAELARARARLVGVVGLLEAIEDDHTLLALGQRTAEVQVLLDEGRLKAALQRLGAVQSRCNEALTAQSTRRRVRHEATDVVRRVADLDGQEAEALRSEARTVETQADLERLTQRVVALEKARTAELDRAYVVQQARSALVEMGYEVGEDFQVSSLAGEAAVVRRPELPDNGLRLQFPVTTSRFLTRVVAFGDTDPVRDAEVEERTCRDVGALQEALEQVGVHAALDHHQQPGVVPVLRADPRRARRRRRAESELDR